MVYRVLWARRAGGFYASGGKKEWKKMLGPEREDGRGQVPRLGLWHESFLERDGSTGAEVGVSSRIK